MLTIRQCENRPAIGDAAAQRRPMKSLHNESEELDRFSTSGLCPSVFHLIALPEPGHTIASDDMTVISLHKMRRRWQTAVPGSLTNALVLSA